MPDPLDRDEFERLVRLHHAAVFRSAQRVLRDDGAAMDVAQEVFLELLRRPERMREAEDPERVLRWMAVKKALYESRGAKNRRRRESERAMDESPKVRDVECDPIEKRELRELLARCIDALPRELRAALCLRFDEELTYASIAELSSCSEPTAHDRVRRALASLRARLERAGYATSAPALAALIEESGRARATAPVPAGLEGRLLALATGAKAAALPALAPLAAGLAVLGCAAVAVVLALGGGAKEERGASARLAPVATELAPSSSTSALAELGNALPNPDRRSASVAPLTFDARDEPASPALPTGAFVGRALDPDRHPVADALVIADSVARQGKFARFESSARTDADGRFRVEARVEEPAGQTYVLTVKHPDFVRRTVDAPPLEAGATQELGELVLARNSDDLPGSFELELLVADDSGAPVAGAIASVSRRLRDARGGLSNELESNGRTDAAGRVVLSGEHLGEKLVLVDAQGQGFRALQVELAIERPGRSQRALELARGLAIAGVASRVEGGSPDGLQVNTPGEDANAWLFADVAPDGRFELRGLDEGEHALAFRAPGRSTALVRLRAGERDARVVLKREEDPRDLGDHMAEIHGRAFDAASGAPIALDFWDLELEWLDASQSELPLEQLAALHLVPPQYQRMAAGPLPEPSDVFHRTGIEPGSFLVVARTGGRAPAFAGPISLRASEIRDGIELRLEIGGTLAGRVVDASGAPLAGAYVWLGAPGDAGERALAELDALLLRKESDALPGCSRTDEAGRFRCERLPSRIALTTAALHPDCAPAMGPRLALREGELREGVELRLAPR